MIPLYVLILSIGISAVSIVLTFYIYISRRNEINRLKSKIEKLEVLADTDYLTGVNSRFSFINKVDQKLLNNSVGVLFIFDLDGFKSVNDTYGHIEGDRLLISFAKKLTDTFAEAIVGRLGGDEFMVFITGDTDIDITADKIIKTDIAQIYDKAENLNISVSFGCASAPDSGHCFNELYQIADNALYKSKKRSDRARKS